ncbi:helix-turn-helix transcriptional regulator [Alicyclobacillus acidoterrestris]|uniref:Helix-turn-helix transcriptional regulator n=1 Tax=Alicyclobacillus acidoterrestris (strain ATCC 49025 / DSM 3922 / CIP 106132 / NCIMB 13137 / GD3B) TaxID=1356854 RepID=T0C8Y1_ALIAG|nr:helix-turn-helix transcriptional regulator [Alicyclobacillus acidoterrestris]EPZ52623.1 hypothetical protein N007_20100 [Alicyclobacillus acidoterrestris ATCC 49025]UNO48266.1 helix-turn-helix transcriptional regulator [Alicyclobacillus acidoterrestris]
MSNTMDMGTNKQSRLKSFLEERGIKQKWLSEKAGITQGWLSKIVNGSEPKVMDAQKIARALGTTVDELWPLEEEGEQ